MEKVTFTLSSSLLDEINKKIEEEYDNRSEALRGLLRRGLEYEDQRENYESKITTLENKLDEKDKMLRQANRRKDESNELVERTQGFMRYLEERKKAGLFTRIKWSLFGYNLREDKSESE